MSGQGPGSSEEQGPGVGDDLVEVCDVCLGEVADDDGVLKVDTAAAERALRAWRARAGADTQELFRLTPRGTPSEWTVRHHSCGAGPVFASTIAVDRIRSWTGLLERTPCGQAVPRGNGLGRLPGLPAAPAPCRCQRHPAPHPERPEWWAGR